MTIDVIQHFLIWSTVINYTILLVWFGAFVFARNFMYRIHTIWFPMSKETFNLMHYSGIGLYKLAIMVFNLVPLIAVCIIK